MKRKYKFWTEEEILFIKQNYGKINVKEISKSLGRGYRSVIKHANKLGIKTYSKTCKKWSKNKVLTEILNIYKKEGHYNSKYIETNHKKLYNAAVRYFSSWDEICNSLGLDFNNKNKKYQSSLNEIFFDSYNECYIGNICFYIEYNGIDDRREYNYSSGKNEKIEFYKENKLNFFILNKNKFLFDLEKILGSINLEILQISKQEIKSKNRDDFKIILLQDLKHVIKKIGKYPSKKEYSTFGKFNAETICLNFEIGWYEIAKLVGFEIYKNKGEKNPRSKLKLKEVFEIKNLIKENYTLSKIAKMYNVSNKIIYNIKRKKTWN